MEEPSCSYSGGEHYNSFQLVQLCAESFSECLEVYKRHNYPIIEDDGEMSSPFPSVLFTVSDWLMDNTELLALFIDLYQVN